MGPVHSVQESSEEIGPETPSSCQRAGLSLQPPQGGGGEHEDSGGAASVDVLDSPFGHPQGGGGEQEDYEEASRAQVQPVRVLEGRGGAQASQQPGSRLEHTSPGGTLCPTNSQDGEQSSPRTVKTMYKFI